MKRLMKDVRMDWMLYALLIPGMVYVVLFHYIPMYGVTNAFREYSPVLGAGDWVGLEIFEKLFSRVAFQRAFWNNIVISLLKPVCGFPVPIILSLMINEIYNRNRLSPIMCKPPEWCRIEASHRRFTYVRKES